VRLIPEKLPITCCHLGVLVDGHQDCADVVIAPAFMHPNFTDLSERIEKRRVVRCVGAVIPLSKRAHDEYHADIPAFEAKYGTHASLLKAFWRALEITPGPWMTEGMSPKRESWFNRVLERVLAQGMSDYERAVFGK
jgi:hypothetical protein